MLIIETFKSYTTILSQIIITFKNKVDISLNNYRWSNITIKLSFFPKTLIHLFVAFYHTFVAFLLDCPC